MNPTADNVFMLIGCSAQSPLFQGFPAKHLPCRNVSGMSCEEYYGCPAWDLLGHRPSGSKFGSGPPECCALPFESIKAINLTRLQCEGYSSAYSLAPLRVDGPNDWSYGIRVKYSVQGNDEFCRACEATGGTCGYGTDGIRQLCMCGSLNSTSNCDTGKYVVLFIQNPFYFLVLNLNCLGYTALWWATQSGPLDVGFLGGWDHLKAHVAAQ